MLDNKKGQAFTDLPYFNETFIQKNQIKSLKGKFQYKKTGDMIRKSNFVYEYYFDRQGRIEHSLETRLLGNIIDTIALYYEYDAKNRLAVLRQKRGDGFVSSKFEYDEQNRIVQTSYYMDIDTISDDIHHPVFERSTFISNEKYTYSDEGATTKKVIYNNYGFPYQEERITVNNLGLKSKVESILKTTSERTITTYEYTEKGWISSVNKESVNNPSNRQKTVFHYDSFGNLTDEHIYKNDKEITEIQIIYSKATGLLYYTIERDVLTGLIAILKIDKVEYYH